MQDLRTDPQAREIRERAQEILGNHQGPGLMTMAEAVAEAREDLAREADAIQAGRDQDRNPKAWT